MVLVVASVTALTLPATRRRVSASFARWPLLPRLLAEPLLFAAVWPYVILRGLADDTSLPRQTFVLSVDRALGLGSTPSERLQGWLYGGDLGTFEWFWLVVHTAWFFMPAVITIYVIIFRWELFPSLAAVRLLVLYGGLIGFFLLPTEPPWMTTDVTRLLEVKAGTVIATDTNPLAAFPSLHVALPAALAFWLWQVRMRRWAALYTAYAILTMFDVIYLGEHYVLDVGGGVALAYVAVRLSGLPMRVGVRERIVGVRPVGDRQLLCPRG